MIRVNENETFSVTAALVDEVTFAAATNKTVYYDVRQPPGDVALSPPLSGILPESVIEPGLYTILTSISGAGTYVVYTTCSGFLSAAENIIVNEENIYELTKQNRAYNIFVEDVIRENPVSTASQTIRKVALGNTDYIINKIKSDLDVDWSTTTVSGAIYAWYKNETDDVPFRMAGNGL